MKIAEVVVKILEKEGLTDAFGIPGAGINPVYKYLGVSRLIKHYLMRHEEAAVHAADGYYRSSGRMAMAICTSGPAATNFVTGIYTAWIDSIPLIAITGQNNSNLLGKGAFQCVDIAKIVLPVCKKSYCILDKDKVVETIRNAFWTAREGRSGPVLIDLPLDIQMSEIDFDIHTYEPKAIVHAKPDLHQIEQAVQLLDNAHNPLVIMGGGVILSKAEKLLIEFAEYMNIPVITTYMAKGGLPEEHPLNAGMAGIQVGASSSGNEILIESDIVLGIGCRFTDRHTGLLDAYIGNRKFIHIDIDPKEIGKLFNPELGIISDAGQALKLLLTVAREKGPSRAGAERVKNIATQKTMSERKNSFKTSVMDARATFEIINESFDDETIYTTGCGLNQIWSGQYQKINKPRKYLPSGGAGTLGFDIPAAIGASIGAGNKKAVCIMGDFGFTFLVEELAVAVKYELPIVVIILNNANLSLIRQNQKYVYGYDYQVEMLENKEFIDYVKVSEGFGCKAERAFTYSELKDALARASNSKSTYVIDVIVENETDCNMGNTISEIKNFD